MRRRTIVIAVLAAGLAVLVIPDLAWGALRVEAHAVAASAGGGVHGDRSVSVTNEVCTAGRALIAAGRPRDAQRLVEAVHLEAPLLCLAAVERAAQTAIDGAQTAAEKARKLETTDPAGARDAVDKALKGDRDNALAQEISTRLASPTPQEVARTAWQEFLASVLTPLGELAVPVAGLLLATLVLARFVIMLPLPWPRSGPASRAVAAAAGVALALVAGTWLAGGLAPVPAPTWWPRPAGTDLAMARMLVALAVAVVLLAYALATRLRVAVEVHGEGGELDEAGTGHVVALLAEIGGERPRGLEVPRGADVSALDGTAISGLPKNAVTALLTTGLQIALGLTPWRLRVDAETPDRHAVTVTRNGRSVAAGVVDRDVLGLRTPRASARSKAEEGSGDTTSEAGLPDLHSFAAAMAIVAMAQVHTGFRGLHGVSDWRSLGLADVASRSYDAGDSADQAARIVLYARALTIDPRNTPAAVGLLHARYRRATTVEDLDSYRHALARLCRQLRHAKARDPRSLLRARVMLSYVIASANQAALPDAPPAAASAVDGLPEPTDVVVDLMNLLTSMARGSAPFRSFAEAMQPSVGSLFLSYTRSPADACTVEGEPAEPRSVEVQWTEPPARGDVHAFVWRRTWRGWQWLRAEHVTIPSGGQESPQVAVRVQLPAAPWRSAYVALSAGESLRLREAHARALPIPGHKAPRPANRPLDPLASSWTADTSRFHPRAHYNYACRPDIAEDEAIDSLRASFSEPLLKSLAARDPALSRLRHDERFQKLVAPPRQALFDIAPLHDHADALRRVGLESPAALASVNVWVLACYLKVNVLVARHLGAVARLWLALAEDPALTSAFGSHLDRFRGQILTALLEKGVASVAALASDANLATDIREAVQEACGVNVTVSDSETAGGSAASSA